MRPLCQHSECQHVHAHGDCKQQSNVWDYGDYKPKISGRPKGECTGFERVGSEQVG